MALPCWQVASKVGPDFLYCSQITHPPEVIEDQKTTEFFADFTQGEERVLKAGSICAPIESMDIPDMDYELGLAVGIACEVLPETLQHMVDVARYVVVDVQVFNFGIWARAAKFLHYVMGHVWVRIDLVARIQLDPTCRRVCPSCATSDVSQKN